MRDGWTPIRSAEYFKYFESFFISAIVAVMAIRLFLKLTNYPILGGQNLHIAHLLWGGTLMLTSLIILLIFLNHPLKKLAAIIGGLGFGTFIDELGKFITKDNNYFYQPVFSLIYIIFVLLYLMFYLFQRFWQFSPKEYLVNSLEYLKEAVINDLDVQEKKLALSYLDKADQQNIITKTVHELYQKLDALPVRSPSLISRIRNSARKQYLALINKKWFTTAFNLFFIAEFIISVLIVIITAITVLTIAFSDEITIQDFQGNMMELISLFASAFSGIFIILGVLKMRKSRLSAYYLFKRSLLISIFLVQVFSFYTEQLSAFTGLLFNILILMTLNYFITEEKTLSRMFTGKLDSKS